MKKYIALYHLNANIHKQERKRKLESSSVLVFCFICIHIFVTMSTFVLTFLPYIYLLLYLPYIYCKNINHTILIISYTYKSESYIIHINFVINAITVIFYYIYCLITFFHLVKFELKNVHFFLRTDEFDNSWFEPQPHFAILYKFLKKCYSVISYLMSRNNPLLLKSIKRITEEKSVNSSVYSFTKHCDLLCVKILMNLAFKTLSCIY